MVGENDSDEWRPPPSSFTCMQGQPVPFPVHVHVYTLPYGYGIQYRPNNVECVHVCCTIAILMITVCVYVLHRCTSAIPDINQPAGY